MKPTTAEPNIDDLLSEFDFAIGPQDEIINTPAPGTPPATPAPTGAELDEEEEEKPVDGTPEEEEEEEKPAGGAPDDTPAPTGQSSSFYLTLAKKYLEQGRWSKDLAIEDDKGNQIPIEEVKDLNEETFFQIEEAIREDEQARLKSDYIQVSSLDERRKNLIEIITSGGDIAKVFETPAQVNQYLNPFEGLDLDDEKVQERIYFNSLVKHKHLDQASAAELVRKAKEDFTLDEKAKDFVADYTKRFDEWVTTQKDKLKAEQDKEKKALVEFRKNLSAEYKEYGLKDSLVKSLTSSAVTKTEDGFEIDSVYAQKMQDPKEAAELVLFLKDKDAYLQYKMKNTKIQEQKQTRRIVKMIPGQKPAKATTSDEGVTGESEFDFEVSNQK